MISSGNLLCAYVPLRSSVAPESNCHQRALAVVALFGVVAILDRPGG